MEQKRWNCKFELISSLLWSNLDWCLLNFSTITYDTLVRAGVHTTSAFVKASGESEHATVPYAQCSRGLKIIPDANFDPPKCGPVSFWVLLSRSNFNSDCGQENYDLLVIPGGAEGAKTMSQNVDVQALVREYLKEKKLVGMICAGQKSRPSLCYNPDWTPDIGSLTALTAGLPHQPITSHPSVKSDLANGRLDH